VAARARSPRRIARFHTEIAIEPGTPVISDHDANRPVVIKVRVLHAGVRRRPGRKWFETSPMHGEEPLRVPDRLEALHPSLALTNRSMTILSPIVQSPPTMMSYGGDDVLLCARSAEELIGHDCTRHVPKTLEQLSKEPLRRFRITALLHAWRSRGPALSDQLPGVAGGAQHRTRSKGRAERASAMAP
jgi:hypothetical protein